LRHKLSLRARRIPDQRLSKERYIGYYLRATIGSNEDLLVAFFQLMDIEAEDIDLLIASEISPLIHSLERASPRLRAGSQKSFANLMGRGMEALAVEVEPRNYFPMDGVA
jgi:hypothetical protein